MCISAFLLSTVISNLPYWHAHFVAAATASYHQMTKSFPFRYGTSDFAWDKISPITKRLSFSMSSDSGSHSLLSTSQKVAGHFRNGRTVGVNWGGLATKGCGVTMYVKGGVWMKVGKIVGSDEGTST